MKKSIYFFVVLVLICGIFAGCGNQNIAGKDADESDQLTEQSVEAEPSIETEPSIEAEPSVEAEPSEEAKLPGPIDASALSDDPFSFQISIDGKVIQLPCEASDLLALGYSFGDKAENILENRYTTSLGAVLDNDNHISVGIYNISGDAKKFSECKVDGIYFVDQRCEGQTIFICKGITFGSTKEEVMAVYGSKADDVFESEPYLYLTYKHDGDYANSIKFCFNEGKLYEIDVDTRE